jgi:hypothetical protein
MSVRREGFFECRYESRGGVRMAIVRAWDVADAAAAFRDLLAVQGILSRGKVSVRPVHGRPSSAEAAPPT